MAIEVGKRYRHYKGKDYLVLALARLEGSLEEVVVYQALYDTEDFGSQPVWVRPLSSFTEIVTIEGNQQPRFTVID